MCSRVGIVTASKVSVVGRNDGVGFAFLDILTIPLTWNIISFGLQKMVKINIPMQGPQALAIVDKSVNSSHRYVGN